MTTPQIKEALRFSKYWIAKYKVRKLILAAEQGDTEVQLALGHMREHGLVVSVSTNFGLAYMWFSIAATYGDEVAPIASKARDHIAKKMSKRQIDWAKNLAAEWIAKHKIERNEK